MDSNVKIGVAALMATLAIIGTGVAVGGEASAAEEAPVKKVATVKKAALKAALGADVGALETSTRAAWQDVIAAREAVKAAEDALASTTPGSVEADAAAEAWTKAQGLALLAQTTFDAQAKLLEDARVNRGKAAAAFVADRCANDDGKDADVKRLCDKLNEAKAEEAAREAAAAARARGEFVPPPGAPPLPAQP